MADGNGPLIGKPAVRIDGVDKVTGAAKYASDEATTHPAYACLVTSSVASGRVTSMDLAAAKAVPGVLDILTHDNVGAEAKTPPGPNGKPTTTSMEDDKVWHDGQIVAVVVAETFEAAREAAYKVRVEYAATPPSATFDSPGVTQAPKAEDEKSKLPSIGDAGNGVRRRPGEDRPPLFHAHPAPQPDRTVHHHLRVGRPQPHHL